MLFYTFAQNIKHLLNKKNTFSTYNCTLMKKQSVVQPIYT